MTTPTNLVDTIDHDTIDHGVIRELKLARPPVNALNPALCGALTHAVAKAVADGVQGLVLSGGPKVFSAGLDVPYLVSLGDDREALQAAWETFFDAARALATSPMPVAAAMAGHAPAGGCVLSWRCVATTGSWPMARSGLASTKPRSG